MDFKKLVRKIYEMGDVYITILNDSINIYNEYKIIGRVDEYENSIQLSFQDDSVYLIPKSQIGTITYNPEKIIISSSDGKEVILEN